MVFVQLRREPSHLARNISGSRSSTLSRASPVEKETGVSGSQDYFSHEDIEGLLLGASASPETAVRRWIRGSFSRPCTVKVYFHSARQSSI